MIYLSFWKAWWLFNEDFEGKIIDNVLSIKNRIIEYKIWL